MLHVLNAALLVLLGATHSSQQLPNNNLQNNEVPFLLSDLPFLDSNNFDPTDSSVDVWQQLESMPPLLDALPDLLYVEEIPDKRGGAGTGTNGRRRPGSHKRHSDRYECKPSREDVVRLLLALHEARGGNSGRTVNFCNRKRPARNILTNLRFVGR
ncbi:Hypothetical predicted protein [Cloeon dipterum]|uniref:Uncharacterized protein n=1 Tax=Cloeon dipterum TaxID=197152 RepID=A0A8S1CTA5_9INSE|nr:Hypothetical predicted protein [Cloeon dipterum]